MTIDRVIRIGQMTDIERNMVGEAPIREHFPVGARSRTQS